MYNWKELLDYINGEIAGMSFERQPAELYAPIRYVLSMGGKRIRPVLMLMAYNLYKEKVEVIRSQAMAIEIYHNYTLLHDDLMDRADMRRGMATVHKKWDDNAAILSGDSMLVMAYRYMQQGCPVEQLGNVMGLFTETALEIGEGQQYDIEFETRADVSEEEYIEMIRLKTSVLLACALKIGAWLGDAPRQDAELLYRFGENLGLAFQLQDDYLDVYGDPAVFGKKIGGDILCNKKTYMLIKALEHADKEQATQLKHWITVTDFDPAEKIEAVTGLYNRIGVKLLCENKMSEYNNKALESLAAVNVTAERKRELDKLIKELMYREV